MRILVEELDVDFVVFYNSLSVQMAERISAVAGCNVIDPCSIDPRISFQPCTQQTISTNEMARLHYDLPLLNSDNDREKRRVEV